MKEVLFIRHAESVANIGKKTTAHDTIPLSEKGKQQAYDLVEKIEDIPDLIVISRYTRTLETAKPFIAKYPTVPVEIWDVHEFTYLNPQLYNGTSGEERSEAVKQYWETAGIHYRDSYDTETFYELIVRIAKCVSMLSSRSEGRIVVFSHGGFIQNLLTYLSTVTHHGEVVYEKDVIELMTKYRAILGTKFPIENVSIHRLIF